MAPTARTQAHINFSRQPAFKRWHLLLIFLAAVIAAVFIIAGGAGINVLSTLYFAALTLPVILPAAMLGVLLTAPLNRAKLFALSPWPDAFRLAVGTALGLGAISIGTMLFGEMHLLQHGLPLLLPAVAMVAGALPTGRFIKTFDRTPLHAPAARGDFLLLLAAVPAAVILIACAFPPDSMWMSEGYAYDVRAYHLPAPREYLAANSLAPLHHNVYSYLPANVEMLYLQLMSLVSLAAARPDAMVYAYPAQYLHAELMALAAMIVFLAPLSIPRVGRLVALLAFCGTPWVIVTGSLAYNEGGLMLFGALALALAFSPPSRAATVTIGIALGLAVGCKLTAGTMFAIPVAAVMLVQRRPMALLLASVVALAVFAPWALRAAADSGDPVFPLATTVFGPGRWTPAQAQRWNVAHAPPTEYSGVSGHLIGMTRESVLDPYWSYVPAGPAAFRPAKTMAEEPRATHIPGPLWLAVAIALALTAFRGPQARLLLIILAVQGVCWLALTHLEARFLLPALIPLAWLIGMGAAATPVPRVLISVLLSAHCLLDGLLLIPEKGIFLGCPANVSTLIGGVFSFENSPPDGFHDTPDRNVVYLVADATPLLYKGDVYYFTPFDENPLITVLRQKGPDAAMEFLAQRHVQFLGINFAEVRRFARTYGFEAGQQPLRNPDDLEQYMKDFTTLVRPLLERLVEVKNPAASVGTHMYYVPPAPL